MVIRKPREIAFEILQERAAGRGYTEPLVDAALERTSLRREDRALVQEIVYGVVRWESLLDWLIAQKTEGRPQKPAVANLLRMALYQMFWLERVPGYAAVNESVALAKAHGLAGRAAFINAVLRAYGREEAETRATLQQLRETDLALGYSHPEWLVRRWVERWERDRTVRFLQWNNAAPSTFARLNALKTTTAALLERWKAEGVEVEHVPVSWAPHAEVFRLLRQPPINSLPSFQEGGWYVQDPSTLLAPELLAPHSGESLLDMCSAPGGKATYCAQLMRNEGSIQAEDADPARLRLIAENSSRLGVTCVDTTPGSASASRLFDRVLVDAPCSNTGVLRRRVDLRWRIKPGEIVRLAEEQLSILTLGAARTRPGGVLVYSTCSLEREENEEVVQKFLRITPGFALEAEKQLTPWNDGVDGAYCARLLREK